MPTSYPGSLDTATGMPTNIVDATAQAAVHAAYHDTEDGAIVAVETKVGAGASVPTTVGNVLTVTGAGASAWSAGTAGPIGPQGPAGPAGASGSTGLTAGLYPYSVGPWPQDDSGWTIPLIGPNADPTKGISRAPQLTTMAVNNQLHLPSSISALAESPPTTMQTQINATASGGVCRITPGYIYREAVTISNPITLLGLGRVSLRGTDDWSPGGVSGCTWTNTSGTIYKSSLQIAAMATDATQGNNALNVYAQNHREVLFSDGLPIVIANTATPSSTQFAIGNASGGDGAGRFVFLGFNPSGHKIEVGQRSTVITSVGNVAVTVDGLDIRQIASSGTGQPTAIDLSTIGSAAINILNCMVGWCHGAGLNIGGKTNLLVENCIFHGCGTNGLSTSNNTNPTYRKCIFFNNGLAIYGWDLGFSPGGLKEAGASSSGAFIDKCIAFANVGVGLWLDVQATRGVIRECVTWDNHFNISVEISSFCTVRDCVSFRTPNQLGGLTAQDIGIFSSNSRWVEIYGNLIMHMPLNFKYLYGSRTDDPPSGSADNTHMGGVTFHDNVVIGRYHATDQGGFSDIAEQWADNGFGAQTNIASNTGKNNTFGWPNLINNGANFLEVNQEPDSRWWHDGGGGNLQVTTLAAWQALQFSAASDAYMLDATRVSFLRRFGLIP